MSFIRLLLVLLLAAVSAVAASITVVQTTPGYPAPGQNVVATQWRADLEFPQFDPALGELISITVGLENSLTASASVPTNGVGGEYRLAADDSIRLVPPAMGPQWPLHWVVMASQRRTMNVASSETTVVFPEETTSNSRTDTARVSGESVAYLAEFIGTDGVSLTVFGGGDANTFPPIADVSGPGPFSHFLPAVSLAAQVSLTYTYNPVPEPGYTPILGMVAVVALALARRRLSSAR